MKLTFAAFALFALLCTGRASASALSDFANAWAKVEDYTCQITTHETTGADVQDRTYAYAFKKPHAAKSEITAGPGKGAKLVWNGGANRAMGLRGDTLESTSFASILASYQSDKGTISESTTDTILGVPIDTVTMLVANPSANKDVSKDVLFISRATHLPVRRARYEGNILVKQEDFINVKVNTGLKDADF
jgi:outer membrane lipoprotein-sorting protein